MTLYLYSPGTNVPALTIENVVSYTDNQAVTEDGGVYGPFAEDVELLQPPRLLRGSPGLVAGEASRLTGSA